MSELAPFSDAARTSAEYRAQRRALVNALLWARAGAPARIPAWADPSPPPPPPPPRPERPSFAARLEARRRLMYGEGEA